MMYIYTRQFLFRERLKRLVKRVLGKSETGTGAVEDSLLRGLSELQERYELNAIPKQTADTAFVVSGGPKVLTWAIAQKRKGLFRHLVAGPMIVVTPDEANGIVLSSDIDAFLVPSQWVKNWWVGFDRRLEQKLQLWPSGVADPGTLVNRAGNALVFQKNAPEELHQTVRSALEKNNIAYSTLRYGHFTPAQYRAALSRSRFMIYLSQSESQGLALLEAWTAGVPTLVWNRGYLSRGKDRWDDSTIAAPFLTPACGMFFRGAEEFPAALKKFTDNYNSFNPRPYALENFSDRASAARLLEIIHSL